MRAIRRVTAFIVSLMVIQLTLATSGYACATQEAVDPHEAMVMGGELASIASAPTDGASCELAMPGGPCESTDTEGACATMGVCAPLVLNGEHFVPASVALVSEPAATDVRAPLTRTTAPESPPPRA